MAVHSQKHEQTVIVLSATSPTIGHCVADLDEQVEDLQDLFWDSGFCSRVQLNCVFFNAQSHIKGFQELCAVTGGQLQLISVMNDLSHVQIGKTFLAKIFASQKRKIQHFGLDFKASHRFNYQILRRTWGPEFYLFQTDLDLELPFVVDLKGSVVAQIIIKFVYKSQQITRAYTFPLKCTESFTEFHPDLGVCAFLIAKITVFTPEPLKQKQTLA